MEKTVRALMIPSQQPPSIAYLYPNMDALRWAVSIGAYEVGNVKSKRLCNRIYIIYNSDYPISELDGNRRVGNMIITGTFYVVATNEYGEMISLTDRQIDIYSARFQNIEHYDCRAVIETNLNAYYDRLFKDEKSPKTNIYYDYEPIAAICSYRHLYFLGGYYDLYYW